MGSYAYCQRCEQGLDAPLVGDVAAGTRQCPTCEAQSDVRESLPDSLNELHRLVLDLKTRVDNLEKHLGLIC